jgi:hypothetical protein
MSKHNIALTVDADTEKAYDSTLLCLTRQEYRIKKQERPKLLEMERGNPWYSTIFLTPGLTRSWKDHYCLVTATFFEDTPGMVRVECVFDWKYSIMRPVIMNLVNEEVTDVASGCH